MNEHDANHIEEVDPAEVFVKLGFPKEVAANAESDRGECPSVATSVVISSEAEPKQSEAELAFWLRSNYLLNHRDLGHECAKAERSGKNGVVAGFLPRRFVSFLVGDSGLGKSPLAYQLGLSVAAGVPFLGMQTDSGVVIMGDYENGMEESLNLSAQVARFLEIPKVPDNFVVWSADHSDGKSMDIDRICETATEKPLLIIIDSLRSHDAHFEKHEYAAGKMNQLNKLAYKSGAAILVIHHIRKPTREQSVPALDSDETRVMQWLKETAGGGSLMNQSHTRIAVDAVDGRSHLEAALILRWYRKSKGEAGPLYLERVCDDEGEPFGYRALADLRLMGNPDQEAAFRRLPRRFTFDEAKKAFGRTDDPTSKWLKKCASLGLVTKLSRGCYERTDDTADVARPMSASR